MPGHLKRWLTVLLNFSLLHLEFFFFLTWISLSLEEFIQIRNEWQSIPGLMRELSSCWEQQCPARISLKRGSRYQSEHVGKQIKIQRAFYFLFQCNIKKPKTEVSSCDEYMRALKDGSYEITTCSGDDVFYDPSVRSDSVVTQYHFSCQNYYLRDIFNGKL